MPEEQVRFDQLVQSLIAADRAGDTEGLRSWAMELASRNEKLSAWLQYVLAGCAARSGDPRSGLQLLAGALEAGGWWGPTLLEDADLRSIWEMEGARRVRTEALRRWERERARSVPAWELVEPARPARALLVVLHGNCPPPADLDRSLWACVDDAGLALVRSSQPQAAGVWDWLDREQAVADVVVAANAARRHFGAHLPVVVAGLGAGGRVAIDVVMRSAVEAAGAMAFAPALGSLVTALGNAEPAGLAGRYWITTGGLDSAARSVDAFHAWATERNLLCRVDWRPDLGHEYPADFRDTVSLALDFLLAKRKETTTLDNSG
jgi:hypothetical protein